MTCSILLQLHKALIKLYLHQSQTNVGWNSMLEVILFYLCIKQDQLPRYLRLNSALPIQELQSCLKARVSLCHSILLRTRSYCRGYLWQHSKSNLVEDSLANHRISQAGRDPQGSPSPTLAQQRAFQNQMLYLTMLSKYFMNSSSSVPQPLPWGACSSAQACHIQHEVCIT